MPNERPVGLTVDWPFAAGVRAFMSMREGGASRGPYASFNLGAHVGDDPRAVERNRHELAQCMQAQPVWLNQVHGANVVDAVDVADGRAGPADAVFATRTGLACTVLVADCLPVLMADRQGRCVAAAHGGWRGVAAGVLENTVARMCREADCDPDQLDVWLGPCIGPLAFEVGDDVRTAFGVAAASHFRPHRRADGSDAWLADLPGLARARLAAAGVLDVHGGAWCTVSDPDRFFSFRRDRVTGRLAAAIARA